MDRVLVFGHGEIREEAWVQEFNDNALQILRW
jgi:hypothetical protein